MGIRPSSVVNSPRSVRKSHRIFKSKREMKVPRGGKSSRGSRDVEGLEVAAKKVHKRRLLGLMLMQEFLNKMLLLVVKVLNRRVSKKKGLLWSPMPLPLAEEGKGRLLLICQKQMKVMLEMVVEK